MKKENTRNYNLDLLRILAAFMVIFIHVSGNQWYNTPCNTLAFNIYNFYDSLVRSAVPLFVMLSGIFFLNPKKEKKIKNIFFKNVFKLILIYIIWSIIYYFYDIIINNKDFSLYNFVTSVINGPYHFWYIPTIIGLYIISPILIKITQNKNTNKIFKYLFIIFTISCTLKTISSISFIPYIEYLNLIINKLPIDIICQYYSYFLLGYFMYNFDISKNKRKTIYILGILSVICCAILTFITSYYEGKNVEYFYNYFSVFTFFEACAIFLFFKHHHFKSESIYQKKVKTISNCTLGIYIIHVLVLNTLLKFKIIQITSFNQIISIPTIAILVFLISLLITYLIRKIKIKGKTIF